VTDADQPQDERPEGEAPAEQEPAAAEAEAPAEEPAAEEQPAAEEEPAAEAEATAEEPAAEQEPAAEPVAEEPAAEQEPAAEAEPPAEEPPAEQEPAAEAEPPAPEQPAEAPAAEEQPAAEQPAAAHAPAAEQPGAEPEEELIEERPRVKPEIPGADLIPDIVPEGQDALAREEGLTPYDEAGEPEEGPAAAAETDEEQEATPIADAAISLASGARYTATGKRKTAVARVILKPGSGEYKVNGKALEEFFPRPTLQRTIRQPLETVAYEAKMDVVAKLHGGGVSAQAGALRHGIARALLEADPNLRGELKRRGFLTRDARAKERKKAGLKKARKRPQFSKR
jgi:small subunit ribosomal protein S9